MAVPRKDGQFLSSIVTFIFDLVVLVFTIRRVRQRRKLIKRDAYISQLENEVQQLKNYNSF